MRLFHCELPLPRIAQVHQTACNQARFSSQSNDSVVPNIGTGNVRLMHRAKDFGNTRFVLSGKLADVCAALDAMAAQEQHSTWRVAAQ